MDKCLRPQIFDTNANLEEGSRKWLHWKRAFESFIRRIVGATDRDKLDLLINFINTNVYSYCFHNGPNYKFEYIQQAAKLNVYEISSF